MIEPKKHYEIRHVFDDGSVQDTDAWAADLEECKEIVRKQIVLLESRRALIRCMSVVAEVKRLD